MIILDCMPPGFIFKNKNLSVLNDKRERVICEAPHSLTTLDKNTSSAASPCQGDDREETPAALSPKALPHTQSVLVADLWFFCLAHVSPHSNRVAQNRINSCQFIFFNLNYVIIHLSPLFPAAQFNLIRGKEKIDDDP